MSTAAWPVGSRCVDAAWSNVADAGTRARPRSAGFVQPPACTDPASTLAPPPHHPQPAQEMGAVETLIVWENLDINRYVFTNPSTGERSHHWLAS